MSTIDDDMIRCSNANRIRLTSACPFPYKQISVHRYHLDRYPFNTFHCSDTTYLVAFKTLHIVGINALPPESRGRPALHYHLYHF